MSATPVFNHPIQAPDDDKFTNGEKGLGVNAVLGSEAVGTYYLAKKLSLQAGVYSVKILLSPGGSVTFDGVTLNGSGSFITQVSIGPGERRIDITLVKSSMSEKTYAALLIYRTATVSYTSDADGWVFSTSEVLDEDIPAAQDPRLNLPVFGLLPNWQNGVTERISYLTDIMVSETAAEQRRALRAHPRRSLEASFLRQDAHRARLDAFAVGVGSSDMLVPVWQEQYRTVVDMSANAASHLITGDSLVYREFAAGEIVLATNGDPANHEVLQIETVDTGTDEITWRKRPSKLWPAGTRLIPLKVAFISDKVSMSNPIDRVGSMTLRFDFKEPDRRFAGSWGYPTPLWTFKIDRGTALTIDYDREDYTLDNQLSPVEVSNPGNRAIVNSRFAMLTRGREALYALRQFIAAARGRAVRFYAPSFTRDVFLESGLGGFLFDARVTGFAENVGVSQDSRKTLAFYFDDGSPTIYRRVLNVARVGSGESQVERFTVNEALPVIAKNMVSRVQFIVASRFDQDSFEFTHLVDEAAAVKSSFVTRSVDSSGMVTPT
jgi:hypothetical protein